MKNILSILICLVFSFQAFGQLATKEEHAPGNLVVVSPKRIEQARQVWMLVYPDTFEQYRIENGKLFLAMPKYQVRFRLLVVPNDVEQDIYFHSYNLTPSGIVVPEDPKPEDPLQPVPVGWAKWVSENRTLLPNDKTMVGRLGDNFIEVSKGSYSDTVALTIVLREKNQATLKDNFLEYVAWSTALQKAMLEADLSKDVVRSKKACFEIGTALKEIAK